MFSTMYTKQRCNASSSSYNDSRLMISCTTINKQYRVSQHSITHWHCRWNAAEQRSQHSKSPPSLQLSQQSWFGVFPGSFRCCCRSCTRSLFERSLSVCGGATKRRISYQTALTMWPSQLSFNWLKQRPVINSSYYIYRPFIEVSNAVAGWLFGKDAQKAHTIHHNS